MGELKRLPAYETHNPSGPCPKCGNAWYWAPTYHYKDRYGAGEALGWVCSGCGFEELTRCKDSP